MSHATIDRAKITLRICQNCKGLDGHHFITTKKRCLICDRITSPLDADFIFRKDKEAKMKSKWPKNIKRFPRELTADKDQQIVVNVIQEKVKDFECPGKITDVKKGPIVTEYEFMPDRYTRLKRLKTLNEDLAVALSAETVTIQRIPGKNTMSISIPNKDRKTVTFNDCLKNVAEVEKDMAVPINFGITASGEPMVVDLADCLHMLVGGQTGSGKSVFLNNLLLSMLVHRSPKELNLYLVDPKSVELFPYKGIPHLQSEPLNDVWRALGMMDGLIEEMKRRTTFFEITGVKNLKEFNALMDKNGKPDEKKPYVVAVFDEIADMILQQKKEFTQRMAQIAQMARASGIYVIAATQRPSVDILKGTIKVNFPTRVAFRVPSAVDSKTILNFKGAEQLLGRGDMFALLPHKSAAQGFGFHLHSPLVTNEERDKILDQIKAIGFDSRCVADGPLPGQKATGTNGKSVVPIKK
jgi:DNA segregation ATPase FtsK/SpoIIIE, S-DNA-T family